MCNELISNNMQSKKHDKENKIVDVSNGVADEFNYYMAYEKRYCQVYNKKMMWSSKQPTPDVMDFFKKYFRCWKRDNRCHNCRAVWENRGSDWT